MEEITKLGDSVALSSYLSTPRLPHRLSIFLESLAINALTQTLVPLNPHATFMSKTLVSTN